MTAIMKSQSTRLRLAYNLDRNTTNYQKTMERLSSGYKYNSISENPIDICKALSLDGKISQNKTLSSNIALGGDVLAQLEGSHTTVTNNLLKINELALQAANETNSTSEKQYLIDEIKSCLQYLNYAADTTNFNGTKLMDGSVTSYAIQVGQKSDEKLEISSAMIDVHTDALDITLDDSVTGDNWTEADIQEYLKKISNASSLISNNAAKIGAYSNSLDASLEKVTNDYTNMVETKSMLVDADVAKDTSEYVKYEILQQAAISVLAQANQVAASAYSLLETR